MRKPARFLSRLSGFYFTKIFLINQVKLDNSAWEVKIDATKKENNIFTLMLLVFYLFFKNL